MDFHERYGRLQEPAKGLVAYAIRAWAAHDLGREKESEAALRGAAYFTFTTRNDVLKGLACLKASPFQCQALSFYKALIERLVERNAWLLKKEPGLRGLGLVARVPKAVRDASCAPPSGLQN